MTKQQIRREIINFLYEYWNDYVFPETGQNYTDWFYAPDGPYNKINQILGDPNE